jgi:hypothetical protein
MSASPDKPWPATVCRRPALLAGVVVALAAALAASCGDDGGGTAASGGGTGSTTSSGEGGMAGSAGATSGGGGAAPGCGDGSCEAGETCQSCPADCGPSLSGSNPRGGDAPVFTNASTYDYSPSVMLDGVYRMWWCCGLGGDHVCHAESSSLDGPWHARASAAPNTYDDTFGPTGDLADFDGTHTCDPSVLRVDGTYYLFYGGIAEKPGTWTRIGVATSADGLSWQRLNGGLPIIDAARDPYANALPNVYGAGQPSATFVDGLFYLIFTDTTGLGGNQANGAGQYVLRSADVTFQSGVEELTPSGFVPYGQIAHTSYSLTEAFASDWQYVDAIDAFLAACSVAAGQSNVRIWKKDLVTPLSIDEIAIPGAWTEEPAIVSRPDKHAVPWSGACGTVALDVIRSVGPGGPATWDLAHAGLDLATGLPCECEPLGRMLEGTLLAVPATPLTLVRGGTRLQFALGPPAYRLAKTVVDPGLDVFNALPYGASVFAGNEVLAAPGLPAAYHLDDDKLWPISCIEEVTDNQSVITSVDAATYGSYAQGYPLFCVE